MLSPFAPHTAEELWQMLGHVGGLGAAAWPSFDAEVAKADEVVVPVQVNGKLRARITAPADATEDRAARAGAGRPRGARTPTARRFGRWWSRKGPLVSMVVHR